MDDFTVPELDYSPGVRGDIRFMGHDHHRAALSIQFAEDGHDLVAGLAIQISGWFVSQDNGGFIDKGTGDGDTLTLTTRKLIWFVVHSVAFAKGLDGRYVDISSDDFNISLNVSAYTLVTAAKAAEPLLNPGSSIVTLTYLGGERVIPNYNTAGIAKAALDASVKYLANDLGPEKGIRVNAISAGPMMTLSARGIKGFVDMYKFSAEVSPLRHATLIDEVGDTCAFLVSNLSRGVTGHILYVDSGYHILGMPTRE